MDITILTFLFRLFVLIPVIIYFMILLAKFLKTATKAFQVYIDNNESNTDNNKK